MDINWQLDILSALDGKISDISETKNGFLLTVDTSTFEPYYSHSVFKCELNNCKELLLKLNRSINIQDIDEFKKYEIEINNTEFKNNKLVVNCLINERWSEIHIETETIKVYDEFNKEISPLDFLIMKNGLCSTGIGIDFQIENSIEDIYEESVKFDEEVLVYLRDQEQYWQRYKNRGPKKDIDLLIGLDEYGDKIFTMDEINVLIKICDNLCSKYKTDNLIDLKIRYFAMKLKETCEEANLKNRGIIAVGD
ncbi:hypothetical protein ACN6MY_19545 [Peribacillus sp. B-H-3]|uniref:hypothetical protein n=1 Tax=Peribacillus sp. B-H-3 TaxID=3400420 RepID=UPI003B011633